MLVRDSLPSTVDGILILTCFNLIPFQAGHVCRELGYPHGALSLTSRASHGQKFANAWKTPNLKCFSKDGGVTANATVCVQRRKEAEGADSSGEYGIGVACKRAENETAPELYLVGGKVDGEGNLYAQRADGWKASYVKACACCPVVILSA